MSNFSSLSPAEKRAFLEASGQRHVGVHSFTRHILHWPYCANCGLLMLKNEVTRKAIKAACVWED